MRKTKILALCTMLLLLALVAGCGSPSMGVKENKADLTVTVVDGTGAAVSDAVVSVNNDANLTTTTDASGKCTIKNATLGSATVRVSKIGYNNFTSPASTEPNHVTIVDGSNNYTARMTYNGGGQVRVTVQDALGKSVGKAPVSVVNPTTHQVIASTISGFDGVAALNVPVNSGFQYQVKVAAEDYKMLPIDKIDVAAGKATEVSANIRSDVHPGTISLNAVRYTDTGTFIGGLSGVTVRVVEVNNALETDASGGDSLVVPAGTYVVGISLPTTTYERPTITGGDALDTTAIAHYLPGSPVPAGETTYRLVTVPADGTATIAVTMYAVPETPPVPVNTSLHASYEIFTFSKNNAGQNLTPNQQTYLHGTFSDNSWNTDYPNLRPLPLAEVNANGIDLQRGTGIYKIVTLVDESINAPSWTTNVKRHAYKLALLSAYTTSSGTTLETFDEDSRNNDGTAATDGNGFRIIPSANHGEYHFEIDAPHGAVVEARGTFNDWGHNGTYSFIHPPIRLVETSNGHFEKYVDFPAGSYQFKYVINNNWEANLPTPSTNREITVTASN